MTRERIFIGGESGAGKTFSWLTMAKYLPDSQFYVAEPDDGVAKILELEYPAVLARGNVHGAAQDRPPSFISDWSSFRAFVAAIRALNAEKKLSPQDWIIIEGLDIITQIIRSEYIEKTNKTVKGSGGRDVVVEDVWDAIITKRSRGAPVLEPSDHDAINYEYERNMTYLAYSTPCNFLCTAGISRIDFDSKFSDRGQKEFYAGLSVAFKYDGHKRNPRMFDTLIYVYPGSAGGQYMMEVLKDRGIGRQERMKNSEFFLDLEVSRTKARGVPK